MKLSDIMSYAQLSTFAEVALLLFVLAFVLATVGLFTGKRESYAALSALPLEDAPPAETLETRSSKD